MKDGDLSNTFSAVIRLTPTDYHSPSLQCVPPPLEARLSLLPTLHGL